MGKQVDVLALVKAQAAHHLALAQSDAFSAQEAPKWMAASLAIGELVAAATEVRDTAWGPGKTDQPHIVRLDAALSTLSEGC